MLVELVQATTRRRRGGFSTYLRHLGLAGLFFLAILDSSPVPTFGGPDILTAILAAAHRSAWYICAAVSTCGSVVGAYVTFMLARRAGAAYLESKFHGGKASRLLKAFERWGTGALAVSSAVPLPFPTSVLFAAAGASDYDRRKYIAVVALCRAARYSLIAVLADHYGRHFIRVVRHPDKYWGWLLLFAAIVLAVGAVVLLTNKKLETSEAGAHREYAG